MLKNIYIQILILKIFPYVYGHETIANMYINVNRVAKDIREMNGGNSYTYTKVANLLSGFKGAATKKEIHQLRKLMTAEFSRIDKILSDLEQQ